MENEIHNKDGDTVIRHCAYCLIVCGSPTKLCGGCKKRAYCSKECQVKDWSRKGNGQRHVNWCRRHECGEEDIDWVVVPIPNKGLGIRAKRLLPAGFKIIVEPAFTSPNGHPGIMDLGPEGGTTEWKFMWNVLRGDNLSQNSVALRMARVNHACQPNTSIIYDDTARVAILYSQNVIQPGEEITICYYTPFFKLKSYSSVMDSMVPESNSVQEDLISFKATMSSLHGVICPSDCFCYDPATVALVREGRKIYPTLAKLTNQNRIEEAMAVGEKLIDIYRRLNVSWESVGNMNYNLFRIAVRKSDTLPRAKEYIRSAVELYRNICPYSNELTKKFEKLQQYPQCQPDYLLLG